MRLWRVCVAVLVPVALVAAVASIVATEKTDRPAGVPLKVSVVSFPQGIVTHLGCRFSPTEDAVTASGRIAKKLGWDTVSLAVYDRRTTLLNVRGLLDSTTVNLKYTPDRRWQITARIVGGFHPARCLLDVGTPSPGPTTPKRGMQTDYLPGRSMYPTVAHGTHGFEMDTTAYALGSPQRGDIVIVRQRTKDRCPGNNTYTVGRIIGLPGETISARRGRVDITSKPVPEPWLPHARSSYTAAFGPVLVPSNEYFVLGDNRAAGCDSRLYGPVPRPYILGKVVAIRREPKLPRGFGP
jgi:signal peptidase I